MGIDVGTLLEGRYRILKQLGAGAMGAVFLAENIRIGRRVAIKVLHGHVSGAHGASVRFQQEARAATAAGSEHIIDILDFGDVDGGELYMVMEYLEGESLKDRMAKGKMREADIVHIARQILKGLAKAHAAGIVHRDLKPDNVYVLKEFGGQKDWVKILDFGICRLVGDEAEAEPSMTQTGMVLGTPHFMSPEHVKGSHHVTFKSDLYAVAAMMYRGLTGEVPFNGSNLTEIMYRIAYEPPPDHGVAMHGVDARLVAIILKGMARDPADRWGSAEDFDRALGQLALGPGADMGESMSATRRTNPPPSALPPSVAPSVPPPTDTNPAVAKSLPLVLGKTAIPADQTTKDSPAPASGRGKRNGTLIFAGAAFGVGSIVAAVLFTMLNKKSETANASPATDSAAAATISSPPASTSSPPNDVAKVDEPSKSSAPATPSSSSSNAPTANTAPTAPHPTASVASAPSQTVPTTPTTPATHTSTPHASTIATDNPYNK
ncbi:MAG: serine/threonine-protein kinase [Polyangiaceae bacterium]